MDYSYSKALRGRNKSCRTLDERIATANAFIARQEAILVSMSPLSNEYKAAKKAIGKALTRKNKFEWQKAQQSVKTA